MNAQWRTRSILAAGVIVGITIAAVWGGIQRIYDSDGVVHSNNAVPQAAPALTRHYHPDQAFAEAQAENKMLVLDFFAQWCGTCKHMEQTTLAEASVQQRLRNFVAVKVDVDQHRSLAQAFGITGVPTTVIATPTGEPVRTRPGYMDVDEYRSLLSEAGEAVRRH